MAYVKKIDLLSEEEAKEMNLKIAKSNAKRIIKDIYGNNTNKSKLMIEKLDNAKTISEVDNVLAWGRVNLL